MNHYGKHFFNCEDCQEQFDITNMEFIDDFKFCNKCYRENLDSGYIVKCYGCQELLYAGSSRIDYYGCRNWHRSCHRAFLTMQRVKEDLIL